MASQHCCQASQPANVCQPAHSNMDLLLRNTNAWDQLHDLAKINNSNTNNNAFQLMMS